METVGIAAAALLGSVVGSFTGAQVWRMRARQLTEDKAAGEKVDERELRRLKSLIQPLQSDRSRCLSCRRQLMWYHLIPIVSWLAARGRCRYCKSPIGIIEICLEVGLAIVFALVAAYWSVLFTGILPLVQLILFLFSASLLAFLFAYDLRWYILPDHIVWPLIVTSVVLAFLKLGYNVDGWMSLGLGVTILSGLYLVLYAVSRGGWIGFGDIKLNLALGLLLMDWRLALLTLFLANLLGTLIVLPGMIAGRITRGMHIPFGPLLITSFFISWWFGRQIVAWLFVL